MLRMSICELHRYVFSNHFKKLLFPFEANTLSAEFNKTFSSFRCSALGSSSSRGKTWKGSPRSVHTTPQTEFFNKGDQQTPEVRMTIREELFESRLHQRTKEKYLEALELFKGSNTLRRGHVEFIYAALKYMEEFGVEDDLEIYKSILDIFPKGKMIPENRIQEGFYHYPKQQQCAIDLLEKMENNGLCPDVETRDIILNTFGRRSHVYKKFARMMYWMPKFKNLSPFPLPREMPVEALELAKLAIQRISVDLQTQISVYQAEELEDALDKTWIVSGQSPTQQRLLQEHDPQQALFVEGPFMVWLKKFVITYYMLRAEPKVQHLTKEIDLDDVSSMHSNILTPLARLDAQPELSVHEQEDGVILALCATGSSSSDSLLSWIRFLHRSNPGLKNIPVLFTLKISPKDLIPTVNMEEPKGEKLQSLPPGLEEQCPKDQTA